MTDSQEQLKITMQGIADLAHSSRPAVTQWRKRFPKCCETPFPEPLNEIPEFDALAVAHWLVETEHGNNPEAVEDAPFFSALFHSAATNPQAWAALVAHARLDVEELAESELKDELFPISAIPSSVLDAILKSEVQTANILAEAAYSAKTVLEKISERQHAASKEALRPQVEAVFSGLLREVIRAHRADQPLVDLVSFGPGGGHAMVAQGRCDLSGFRFTFPERSFSSELCEALAARAEVESETDEFDPKAIIVGQWVSATVDEAKEFFDSLDNFLLGLDEDGLAIVLGPAELMVHASSREVQVARRNFLWDARGNLTSSLCYSALLPNGWARHLGQRQLALWAFRRPSTEHQDPGLIVLADHSAIRLDTDSPRRLINDVVIALGNEVSPRLHAFSNAKVMTQDAVRQRDSLRPTVESSRVVDAPQLADLRAQADRLDIDVFGDGSFVQVGSPYEQKERRLVTWAKATKGKDKFIQELSGTQLKDLDVRNPEGGIEVVGRNELLGLSKRGGRKADLVELTIKIPKAELTLPGDVIVVPGAPPVAEVDGLGGRLVEAPAFVLRCLSRNTRGSQPLRTVTDPYVLVDQLRKSKTKDKESWLIPAMEAADAQALRQANEQLAQRSAELMNQLGMLQKLQTDLGEAVVTGSIRAAPG